MKWKASGEDDDDDTEEAIDGEQLERSSDNESGYVGVTANRDGWRARCRIGGKQQHIGMYPR